MADDLGEVLQGRIESHLGVDALVVVFRQIECVDKVRRSFPLCIC